MSRLLFTVVTLFVSLNSFGHNRAPYSGIWCGVYEGRSEKLVIDENNGVKIYEGSGNNERLVHGGMVDFARTIQIWIEQTPGQGNYLSRGESDFELRNNGRELRIKNIETQREVVYLSCR